LDVETPKRVSRFYCSRISADSRSNPNKIIQKQEKMGNYVAIKVGLI